MYYRLKWLVEGKLWRESRVEGSTTYLAGGGPPPPPSEQNDISDTCENITFP